MRKVYAVGLGGLALLVAACVPPPPPPPPPPPDTDVLLVGDSVGFGVGCIVLGHNANDPDHPPSQCPPEPDFSSLNGYLGACSISQGQLLLYDHRAIEGNCNDPATNYTTLWGNAIDAVTPELVVIVTGGWEIVDRWSSLPLFCDPNFVTPCAGVDRQWASATATSDANAEANYRAELNNAIDLITARGAKVLVLNSPYVAPTQPSSNVWYEAYGPSQPGNWVRPNNNTPFVASKAKIDRFNAVVKDVIDQRSSADIQMFDFWKEFSPDGEYSDYVCPWPDNEESLSTCAGEEILARAPDHGHFTGDGNEILAEDLLPKVREMLGIGP